ncbi:hypothetical protein [Pelagibacterium montanilacus]|uniref:hypothetical protein n=1 Tax=Pelagibacterium montanilacus TaxID=2185280 RepID=UPI000F8F63A5|nr:hypothetical protein [Pelagibacterium montanilacus]
MTSEKRTPGLNPGTDASGPQGPAQAHPPAAPGQDKDKSARSDIPEAEPDHHQVAAFHDKQPAGPDQARVQVREAGKDAPRTPQGKWDDVDEASDESFPASDPPARY